MDELDMLNDAMQEPADVHELVVHERCGEDYLRGELLAHLETCTAVVVT